jgi:hypothetical protein
MGLMAKPVHARSTGASAHIGKVRRDPNSVNGMERRDLGTVKADRMSIASARRAESLVVPNLPRMLAKGGNSLLQRQQSPKLQ